MLNTYNGLYDLSPFLYKSGCLMNPFTNCKNTVIFADDTASGRPNVLIEKMLQSTIYPFYSNTHSNAACGTLMNNYIIKCRKTIREQMNLDDNKKIIFTGYGATGAVNHLTHKINFSNYSKCCVFVSPFEHHSNLLPWKEAAKLHKNIAVDTIDVDTKINLDVNLFLKKMSNIKFTNTDLLIVSMTGCSNVTGKMFTNEIAKIWKFIVSLKSKMSAYLLIDYACSAPHITIDGTVGDCFFLSGHKFWGGHTSPGCLIVSKELLQTNCPYAPGGGCVVDADDKHIVYKDDLESKEEGGTPNIVGIIRMYYVLQVNMLLSHYINYNEKRIKMYCWQRMKELKNKYGTFKIVLYDNRTDDDLPIYPIMIDQLHYNFITVLLSDLFGIQTRGGISCSGILARTLEEKYKIDGWCRITFSFLMTKNEIKKIFSAIEHIIVHGASYLPFYTYDEKQNYYKNNLK